MRLVLASASPARRRALESAGITPLVRVSHVDEDAVRAALPPDRRTPADQVVELAKAKARAVTSGCADGAGTADDGDLRLLVVGCDSMFALDRELLGKPHTPDRARARIRSMRGRDGVLWTGHHMVLLRRADAAASHGERVGPGVLAEPDRTNGRRAPAPASARRTAAGGLTWTIAAQTSAVVQTTVHFADMDEAEIDAYVDSGEPLEVAGSFTIDGLGGAFVTGVEGDPHSVVGISLPNLRLMARRLGVFWPDLWDWRRGDRAGVRPGAIQ